MNRGRTGGIPLAEDEFAILIRQTQVGCESVRASFGPGHVTLAKDPPRWQLLVLAHLRSVPHVCEPECDRMQHGPVRP